MDIKTTAEKWVQPLMSLVTILAIRRLQFTIAQLLVIFTGRDSLLRAASIPVQVALGTIAFHHVQHAIVAPISIHYLCLAGGTVALQTILSISFSSMIRLDNADATAISKTPSLSGKLGALTDLMNNQRCLGTPYQISWVPPFDEDHPDRIPPRREALGSKAMQMVAGYLFRQVLITLLWPRIHLGLFWCLYIASWLNSIYMFGDLVGLLAGNPVEAHPPAFGSLRHTKTIRGFWGKYWHQSNRFPFQGASNYICKEVLGLRGLIQRYTNILFVFTLSGVFHLVTDKAEGISLQQSNAMSFFCSQAVGIMVEDGVQELWRRWNGYRRADGFVVPVWAKAVGYLWTWTFLSVTAEWFIRPHVPIFLLKHGTPFGLVKTVVDVLGLEQFPGWRNAVRWGMELVDTY
ncbi:membrane bound O-acyl transferase family-domain-containing protein [Aspergillus cavernicola]|uniref:Membrane bound O-acyl transferase family-domain-containing protein n=1 Tax=Aspergillus cavernicola TaxID=176166 RepID=A0ABR4I8X9_9EURO